MNIPRWFAGVGLGVFFALAAAGTAFAQNPAITSQPQSTGVAAGSSVSFSVTATGTPAPTYQWLKGGVAIPGATGATYTINSTVVADNGTSYSVAVTNSAGTINSSSASLTVFTISPSITTQPNSTGVNAGQSASFSVVATGAPNPTYQWRKGGVAIPGATGATYTIASTVVGDAGSYDVVVTNVANSVTSSAATLTVNTVAPAITSQPNATGVTAGQSASFSVVATGAPSPTYQWRKGGVAIPGATSATYTIASTVPGDAGSYSVVVTNIANSVTSNAVTLTVNTFSPTITSQPNSTGVTAGQSASFSVVATGAPTPTYQWRKGGVAIPGATSATYTIASTVLGDAGSYTVVVTNVADSVTSSTATLTVNAVAPAITSQPNSTGVNAGQSASFSVVATGAPSPTYQWRKGGVAIPGATGATYTIPSTVLGDAGSYDVVVTNAANSVTSSAAALTVNAVAPSITSQPNSTGVNAGQSASFSVVATGAPSPTYQWRKGGVAIPGATGATYTIPSTVLGDAGSYDVVVTNAANSVTSSAAALTVNAVAPSITSQPNSTGVNAGQSASFSVVATGAPSPTYQWRKGGVAIPGATGATYTIPSTVLGDAGSYDVVVTNAANSVTSSAAALTVNAVAPSITSQPNSTGVNAGQSASFSVVATGAPSPTYQWRKGGVAIPGATSATYTIGSTVPGDAGSYDVVVTNSANSVTSSAVALTVNPAALSITSQPVSTGVNAGLSASFSVVASGASNPSYQWRKGGVAISGATGATYTIGSTVPGDAGTYDVVITSGAASVTSSAVTLTVNGVPPSITSQPSSQAANAGAPVTLNVAATGSPTVQWQRNGVNVTGGVGAALTISSLQPADTGLYVARATSGGTATSQAAIVGVSSLAKLIGPGTEFPNIFHAGTGFTYDQILLEGAAAAVTADATQILRISYIDLNNDIVQVEFSGAGTLSLVLDGVSGPAIPLNYNQAVTYMKGHAGIVLTGANVTTNLSVFSVGRANAANQALFSDSVTYDGFADIAFVAITSTDGKFGGLRTANASYFGTKGLTGVYAPGVEFTGPIFVGDIRASDDATPVLTIGSGSDVRITGGDLLQDNGRAVQVRGISQLRFTAGSSSHGTLFSAQANRARLEQDGVNVTSQIVVNP